ncbi:unnamed protein product, partial [Mesorhabditis spiculigera]
MWSRVHYVNIFSMFAGQKFNDKRPEVYDSDHSLGEEHDEPGTSNFYFSELNLQELDLDVIPERYVQEQGLYTPLNFTALNLSKNRLLCAREIRAFKNVTFLDLSNNQLVELPKEISALTSIRTLIARNNLLEELPGTMAALVEMESLNLAGNRLTAFPTPCLNMPRLRQLQLGANEIPEIPHGIGSLVSLELLYLGGNRLVEIPATIGLLGLLSNLNLSDNLLESLPSTVAELQELEILSLHNNRIRTLPTGIVKLRNLAQLTLRGNPLVAQFVSNFQLEPPKLKELAGRALQRKLERWRLREILPRELIEYLKSANQCVNPKCKGVYFEACVEHVKFVDFCGKYRVPLLEFLCSPRCSSSAPACVTSSSDTEDEGEEREKMMRKVLLG